ncbi:MAG: peptidoglycan-binding protein [Oscillospiraceae bacterium]|nr:peptidoglycan-binding protein [Oscillospiraceae bacterium]
MVTVIPYVPKVITVHWAGPSTPAANVTVPFIDYVKNVASSEIYPTWEDSALTANILAIISFALNRVYTEFYRSQGYDFDITSSTAIDQKFINGRNYFDSISRIIDEIFNDYLRRQGFVEPLAAKFCNGTTVTCAGLSQWGSQNLAQQGLNSTQILRRYYGDNVEIVRDAPLRGYTPSYPGTPLRRGSRGPNVVRAQVMLNRIGRNYPAIPRISAVDGIFGPQTENAVRSFQRIFGLTVDGIIGKATWYRLVRLYVGVNSLAELESEGQTFYAVQWQAPGTLQSGNRGQSVRQLQFMLRVLSEYIPEIPPVAEDGIFGPKTRQAVLAFQRFAGLTADGIVGPLTWSALYDRSAAIASATREIVGQFPGIPLRLGASDYQ